jgi:uncharacterized protein
MLTTEALLRISKEVGAPVSHVETTISLLESGATVPFIARYRKEATGSLDELRFATSTSSAPTTKDSRSAAKRCSEPSRIGQTYRGTKQRILACYVRSELEDIYLPFKPKRRTKAPPHWNGAGSACGIYLGSVRLRPVGFCPAVCRRAGGALTLPDAR